MMKRIKLLTSLLLLSVILSCNKTTDEAIYVSGRIADCQGVPPQKCLQIKLDQDDDWTNFHENIEGFIHKECTDFKLKVKRETIQNPPTHIERQE